MHLQIELFNIFKKWAKNGNKMCVRLNPPPGPCGPLRFGTQLIFHKFALEMFYLKHVTNKVLQTVCTKTCILGLHLEDPI